MLENLSKLLKHTLIYGIGNMASKGLAFLLIPLYTAYLNPSDYGILQICRIITTVLSIFILMGMSSSMFRVYYIVDDVASRRLIVNSTIVTFLIISVLILFPLFIFSSKISYILLGVENSNYIFLLLLATIFTEGFFSLQLAVLRAEEKSKIYSVFSIVRVVLYAVFSIIFVAVLKQKYIGAIQAGLITLFLITLAAIPFTIKGFKFQLSVKFMREILHIGIPLAIGGLGIWILNLSDRYMLKYLISPDSALYQVGLYSLGDKIAMIIKFLIVMPFMLAWGALMFAYSRETNAKEIYKYVLNYFCFVIGIVGLFVTVFGKDIIILMSQNASFYEAYKVIPLLSFSKVIAGIITVISVGVIITRKAKYVAITNFIAAVINILLNFILIPKYNILGAAIASFIAFLVNLTILYYFAQKIYHIPYEMKKISLFFGFLILITILANMGLAFNLKLILFLISLSLLPAFRLVSYSQVFTFSKFVMKKVRIIK
jgi:O-antigen/teichoic acid export membrane protein